MKNNTFFLKIGVNFVAAKNHDDNLFLDGFGVVTDCSKTRLCN